jgi:hypothetical protein
MAYEQFKGILNKEIFEESKSTLMEKISKNPMRYIGLFRLTKPNSKINYDELQPCHHNLLQRHNHKSFILLNKYNKINRKL